MPKGKPTPIWPELKLTNTRSINHNIWVSVSGKIENYFLELLEMIFVLLYLTPEQKYSRLALTIAKLDNLKFFLQLAWENKCLTDTNYSSLSISLDEVGRMLGGWKKGLEKKTPPK